jgi:hypothetical protein
LHQLLDFTNKDMPPYKKQPTREEMECIYSHKQDCDCQKPENPKEAIGQAKPSIHHIPPRVLLEVAQAMMEGSKKYGIYNYRKAGVSFSTYYSSTFRHLIAWFEGEDIDKDSGLNHVVKAIAGLCVLYDSILEGNYQDDRPNTL